MASGPLTSVDLTGPEASSVLSGILARLAAGEGGPAGQDVSDGLRGAVVTATSPGAATAFLLGGDHGTGLLAAGFLVLVGDRWRFEVARALPAGPAGEVPAILARRAIHQVASRGGGVLEWLVRGPEALDDGEARGLGFSLARRVLQMRVPLPLGAVVRQGTPPLALRPFEPGSDEDAWLEANNRAFADHPDQGAWDMATLLEREAEPWFDPAGFLVLAQEGSIRGACWTKVHQDHSPVLGEIYVIFVDPACHGRGWGKALTVAGLDWLFGAGVEVGMLYVDAANATAVRLYRHLGFTEHHDDRVYTTTV